MYQNIDSRHDKPSSWRFVRRTFNGELLVGLWLTFKQLISKTHTTRYPLEKLPLGPRYRAIHQLMRLLESGNERCIGCGLCEKICISNCIRMHTHYGEDGRKKVASYTINFGRCIFCGFCAEVCPELAIVHGGRYENGSEQRAYFALKEDMLTPIDAAIAGTQKEFMGFGSPSFDADKRLKQTPLCYIQPESPEAESAADSEKKES
ncbi:MAG: NADH-quinone oxidoreductase subunit NuoI [Helicobacter sp.]|nr:NADH-quinone oxidoreductase subunit NuoI [Helicobacter sp.]MDE6044788.1 NADH-quinone oxidoreductase subunit NuoI [Helicobacter sp.]MDE7195709.1 NADH-quinone oxidoreductase subunit NuoI [Helicobacter sp.]